MMRVDWTGPGEATGGGTPAPLTSRSVSGLFVRLCPSEVEKLRGMTTSVANPESSLSPGKPSFLPVDDSG